MSHAPVDDTAARATEAGERVTFLDQALWAALGVERPGRRFAEAWLTLQCRQTRDAARGVLLLRDPDGRLGEAARWPEGDGGSADLAETVGRCAEHGRGVATVGRAGRNSTLAYPVLLDGRVEAVVGVETAGLGDAVARDQMRGLQWGTAWLELTVRRQAGSDGAARLARSSAALETLAVVLAARGFANQARAAATDLANRTGGARVAVGWVKRRRARLVALSHGLGFSDRMESVGAVTAAMDEAIDQARTVACPPPAEAGALITRAHAALLRGSRAGAALTVPLTGGDPAGERRIVGALLVEFHDAQRLGQDEVDLLEAVAVLVGPALEASRTADRPLPVHIGAVLARGAAALLGAGHLAAKLATLAALALVAFFATFHVDYRLSARATVEGEVRRTVAAALDGYVASEHARAGETVRKGAVLAALDQTEFTLQRLRWIAVREQHEAEISKNLAAGQRADVNILRAQVDEANAQVALLDDEIARTTVVAPFDGVILSGDLSQSVGAPVQKAQVLFEIAPLDAYRVVVRVPDAEIGRVATGQDGTLALTALPDHTFPFTVTRLTPVAEVSDGQNAFRVEGRLTAPSDQLRPNMEGVARIGVGRELLFWVWTHRLAAAVRLALWSWWP